MIKKFLSVAHRFLIAAIIVILVTGFVTMDISITYSQKLKSYGMQLIKSDLASLEKADAWLNSQPLTPAFFPASSIAYLTISRYPGTQGKSSIDSVLYIYMYQLAAYTALYPGLEGEI